jgi:hypothetical protein
MTKITSLSLGVLFMTAHGVAVAGDWSEKYTPTRAEWLEYVVKRDVTRWTDLWKTRVALNVLIKDRSKEVWVVVTPANGEAEFNASSCANYKAIIQNTVAETIKKYDWATGATIKVECV